MTIPDPGQPPGGTIPEAGIRIAEIAVRAATYQTITVPYDALAAAWLKDQGIPGGPDGECPEPHQLEGLADREWFTGPVDDLLTPLLGDTGGAVLRVESVTILTVRPPGGRYPGAHCAGCGAWYLAGHGPGCWVAVAGALDEAGEFTDVWPGDYAEACRQLTVLRKLAGAVRASGLADAPAEDSDACAGAMTALHDKILSAVPAARREHAEDLIRDLMDLTGENLSGPARDEVIRRALSGEPRPGSRP